MTFDFPNQEFGTSTKFKGQSQNCHVIKLLKILEQFSAEYFPNKTCDSHSALKNYNFS